MIFKWTLLLPLAILLIGCSENYRYPCQDPDNWDKQICKKPWCSANGTCPEDLTHYEKNKAAEPWMPPTLKVPPQNRKGDCT
jgi:hypothetical protein